MNYQSNFAFLIIPFIPILISVLIIVELPNFIIA